MRKRVGSIAILLSAILLILAACGGKAKIGIGPAGSATNTVTQIILEAYGVEEGDYSDFQEGFGDAADLVQDGNIDVTFGVLGLPAGNIESLQASTGDVVMLGISDELIGEIEEKTSYERFTIPKDSYEFLEEDIQTVAAFAVMIGNTNTIDEELGYELARIMVEHSDEITHAQGEQMTLENALNGAEGIPIHPGAAKYYEEQGLEFDNPIAEITATESDRKTEFVLGSGSQGGTYYPLGGEIANVWKTHLDTNFTNIETGASIENIMEISNGDMDLGMTVHVPALDALSGINDFEEAGEIDGFAYIGHVYPEVVQIVTREAAKITDLSDLK